jgi:hypothetical protein
MTNQLQERQAGTELREIEITSEMIEAGADALVSSGYPDETPYVVVGQILEAMNCAQARLRICEPLELPDLARQLGF